MFHLLRGVHEGEEHSQLPLLPLRPPPSLKQKLEENMKMQVSFSSNFWLPDQTLKTLNKEYAWKWDFNHIFPIRVD